MEAARDGGHLAVNLHVSAVESRRVEVLAIAADAAGRRLVIWTVNNPLQMEELQEAGIAGIITDDPSLAVETLRSD
jgi:glycerophosphoryl diester phosphodiesterase